MLPRNNGAKGKEKIKNKKSPMFFGDEGFIF